MQRARHKDGFYRLKNFCDRPEILGQSEPERVTQWARRHVDGSHLVPPMSVLDRFEVSFTVEKSFLNIRNFGIF